MPPPGGSGAPAVAKPKGSLVARAKAAFRKHIAIDMRLYADYSHSGKVEETDTNYNLRGTFPGAILYHACRPSKKPLASFKIHAEEDKILDAKHLGTVTTVKLVHTKGLQKGDEVILWMSGADADKVRLYEEETVGAKAILGKGIATEAKIKLSVAVGSSATLCMCAVAPPSAKKEAVTLNVKVMRKGKEEFKDSGLFGIAPWLMPHTLAPVTEAYVIDVSFNTAFRSTLKSHLASVGINLVELNSEDSGGNKQSFGDQWAQDIFELGVMTRKGESISVAINSANSESRDGFPGTWSSFLDQGHGMIRQGQGGNSMSSYGNLEVTPPLKGFPLGKKYYGVIDASIASAGRHAEIPPPVKDFLASNPYQPVTEIPTNWLTVGHVDEFLSIVPVKGGAGAFKILYASPAMAQIECKKLQDAGLGKNKICPGKAPFDGTEYEISVDDYLKSGNALLKLNTEIEKLIRTHIIENLLSKDWQLPVTDFVPIPTIFNGQIITKKLTKCLARTAGMVNCLVLGEPAGILIMPEPFGPRNAKGEDVFVKATEAAVAKVTGLTVKWIDDWEPYHVVQGEVHCGTNVKRSAPDVLFKWWNSDLEINGSKVN